MIERRETRSETEYSSERSPNEIRPPFIPDSFIGSLISRNFLNRTPFPHPFYVPIRASSLEKPARMELTRKNFRQRLLPPTVFSIVPSPFVYILPSNPPRHPRGQVSFLRPTATAVTSYRHKVQKNAINEKTRTTSERGYRHFSRNFCRLVCGQGLLALAGDVRGDSNVARGEQGKRVGGVIRNLSLGRHRLASLRISTDKFGSSPGLSHSLPLAYEDYNLEIIVDFR